jgi:phenylalanyl-tRNA synthetase alpha chain
MLNKWVEVGNSGMFRPEMLEPMGFPKDVHVHGWGISLERPTMIRCVFDPLCSALPKRARRAPETHYT